MAWFDRLFGKKKPEAGEQDISPETFRERYAVFLEVLSANNRSLEAMADLEEALKGERLFGLGFVRSHSSRALEAATEMARGLVELAPGKYGALAPRLEILGQEAEALLRIRRSEAPGPYVLDLAETGREKADLVGGKMASLAELASVLHVAVPKGFTLTSVAFDRFLEHNGLTERIRESLEGFTSPESMDLLHGLSLKLQQMMLSAEVPEDVARAMDQACARLEGEDGGELRLALRSSAVGEDFADTSFAGQYHTELNVGRENIREAYREVLASKYTLTAMSYRLARGISDEETPMCVGCLRMVKAVRGGVMYTRNPMPGGEDELLVSAVFGLPKGVVDGGVPSDLYVLRRTGPISLLRSRVEKKTHKYISLPGEGIGRKESPAEEIEAAVLSPAQAVALAELGLTIEAFYNRPMDVEWAYDESGALILLQCRPLSVSGPGEGVPVVEDGAAILSGGVTASKGVDAGVAHQVLKEADMLSFPKGGVLVAAQSSPRLAPLLSRASALVCEQGGIAGHLANVAREFGIPALFGVPGAQELLPTGMEVTVDADARAVFPGRALERIKNRSRPRNLMRGSTVLKTLQEVTRLIVPLTLLDPDSPSFRASACVTAHDVTRFCHEKAVHEMFRFGKRNTSGVRRSKRLVTGSAMQWWVLDLDDGLSGVDRGKYVHLNDIVSIPMLALWDGITAVPWQGPPALDGRGFMSVLFHSTMNRSLAPGAPSQYATRNYFMISKNYCSLHSRFGYHFAQVEGLVGERARDNFAGFRFQGGAADDQRRQRRVEMVGGLLEERGFRISQREDRLTARLERLDRPGMESGLRVLGYLLMHTRQLDMIMNNQEQSARMRNKLKKEMEAVAALTPLPRQPS